MARAGHYPIPCSGRRTEGAIGEFKYEIPLARRVRARRAKSHYRSYGIVAFGRLRRGRDSEIVCGIFIVTITLKRCCSAGHYPIPCSSRNTGGVTPPVVAPVDDLTRTVPKYEIPPTLVGSNFFDPSPPETSLRILRIFRLRGTSLPPAPVATTRTRTTGGDPITIQRRDTDGSCRSLSHPLQWPQNRRCHQGIQARDTRDSPAPGD